MLQAKVPLVHHPVLLVKDRVVLIPVVLLALLERNAIIKKAAKKYAAANAKVDLISAVIIPSI